MSVDNNTALYTYTSVERVDLMWNIHNISAKPRLHGFEVCCSIAKSCVTLCDPTDCSTPGSTIPRVCSNSCPLSQWCYLNISSSVTPFSSCPQSFPASGSFPRNQLFASGGQNIGVSAPTSVLLINIQHWFPLGWTGWISLQSKRLFKSLLQHHSSKTSILWCSAFFIVQLSHPYMTTGKP